jgi:glutamate-ammonia-ligase adenylyltransferase
MNQNLSLHPLLQDDQYHWLQLLPVLQSDDNQFSEDFQLKIQQLAIASSYALMQLCREPSILPRLQKLKHFEVDESQFHSADGDALSIEAVKRKLRQFRHRKLIEIIYLDVTDKNSLQATLAHLSDLADLLIQMALEASNKTLVAKHGQPLDENGNKIGLNIIAMGKLGGRELNFSSDIDLICCYANDGELDGYGRLTHQEFFTRVTRLFTQLLNEPTEDGFVYRVDLRLRPWGDSGPVALSHAALEHYYQLHGREWEQYALVKARILTGNELDKRHLASILKPFVYRKYHDYRVFEGLAALKDKINIQARSRGMQDNIKLGHGGIREIEFFVQAFQILKGGRNKQLQSTQIFHCFEVLEKQNIVDPETIEVLREAYIYLRQLENKFQMLADEQTHSCPKTTVSQNRIAATMGYSDWQAVNDQLQVHRQNVSAHFTDLFKPEVETPSELIISETIGDESSEIAQIEYMQSIGLNNPDDIYARLTLFFGSKAWNFMSAKAKKRFSTLIPRILTVVTQSNQQLALFERLLNLFSSIAGRSVYFELLHQNTALLEKLVNLFDKSEWIAQEVANYPMLLEHLIQAGDSSQLFDQPRLQQNLQTQLDNVICDEELELDVLRLFKREQTIVIAVAELSGEIGTTDVGLYLSELAEIVLQAVYRLASNKMQLQYGLPCFNEGDKSKHAEFAIIGYGKLGGREMHYQSDLDIIFLHNSTGEKQITQGPKCIDNSMYFARLAQKIISMTSVLTGSGKLYEIDSRLRPEGSSGLLVSSLKAYHQYQLKKAWTWEHQALIRARYVAGSAILEPEFNHLRAEILTRPRELKKLQGEIYEMRDKIYKTKNPPEGELKNLKHSRGCMIDIEFMVQFWTLLYANKVGSIASNSDNIGLLKELFRLKLISSAQSQLADIYQTYHRCLHETVLQNKPAEIGSDIISAEVEHVVNCWNECFSDLLEKK